VRLGRIRAAKTELEGSRGGEGKVASKGTRKVFQKKTYNERKKKKKKSQNHKRGGIPKKCTGSSVGGKRGVTENDGAATAGEAILGLKKKNRFSRQTSRNKERMTKTSS